MPKDVGGACADDSFPQVKVEGVEAFTNSVHIVCFVKIPTQ